VLLVAGVMALAGCGTDSAPSDGPDVTGEWQLASGTALGAELLLPAGTTATLALSRGQASGVAFCNRFSASYELDGSSFEISDIGSTEIGCEPDVMAAESTYLAALDVVDTAVLDGADLLLTGPGVELRFGPVPVVPDSPLEGTRWVLETLVDGETASSVLAEPLLELAPDGTATGTTGCNGWTSTWRQDGDVLAVDPLITSVGCDADESLVVQDAQVTAVLAARPTVAIDGDRLALTAPDGRGLGYRAG
jgi:heat shock protein HslJ